MAEHSPNITREQDSDYSKVVLQAGIWRVIECRDGIQWIIQRRAKISLAKPRWRPISYCATRKALIRLWHEKTSGRSPVLERLSETTGGLTNG
jgi:hypothetical protein